jgi:hypothetical protein
MSVADMKTIEDKVGELVETFRDLMIQVFDEEPEIFEDRNTKLGWHAECHAASEDLEHQLNIIVERVEGKLHDGEFH